MRDMKVEQAAAREYEHAGGGDGQLDQLRADARPEARPGAVR
jgi:hypothetical protein